MLRIAVTGATGFIGTALVERLLARGDGVTAFTRNAQSAPAREGLRWVTWDPLHDGAWQRELDGQHALIHLAGASAVGRRYTESVRREIRETRVESTARLVTGMSTVTNPPRVFVCASGVGYYGARADEVLDESAPAGSDFLAEVCVAWEAAARAAERLGVRVVSTRIGFVLGKGGGALARLVPIFKAGVGGRIGHGRQWASWIHLDDVVGAMLHAIGDSTLVSPVNATAPNPVTNAELTRALADALHRPAALPVPAFALRAVFGEGAEPLLTGQRVIPRALIDHGYPFRFIELAEALRDLLAR